MNAESRLRRAGSFLALLWMFGATMFYLVGLSRAFFLTNQEPIRELLARFGFGGI